MKLLRETISREIKEVFFPRDFNFSINGVDVLFKEGTYLRVGKLYRVISGGRVYSRNLIEYQYATIGEDKKETWIKLNPATYNAIINFTRGWMPDYRGSFKVSKKIIGIVFK